MSDFTYKEFVEMFEDLPSSPISIPTSQRIIEQIIEKYPDAVIGQGCQRSRKYIMCTLGVCPALDMFIYQHYDLGVPGEAVMLYVHPISKKEEE